MFGKKKVPSMGIEFEFDEKAEELGNVLKISVGRTLEITTAVSDIVKKFFESGKDVLPAEMFVGIIGAVRNGNELIMACITLGALINTIVDANEEDEDEKKINDINEQIKQRIKAARK